MSCIIIDTMIFIGESVFRFDIQGKHYFTLFHTISYWKGIAIILFHTVSYYFTNGPSFQKFQFFFIPFHSHFILFHTSFHTISQIFVGLPIPHRGNYETVWNDCEMTVKWLWNDCEMTVKWFHFILFHTVSQSFHTISQLPRWGSWSPTKTKWNSMKWCMKQYETPVKWYEFFWNFWNDGPFVK